MLKKIALISFLICITYNSKAATGCLSNNTTYTYIYPMNATYQGVPAYYHRYESDRRLTASNFCTTTKYPIRSCYIYATREGYSSSPGTIVEYYTNPNQCQVPLDANVWYLILPLAGVSFLVVRKQSVEI